MAKSKEFNRDGDPEPKDIVRTGPVGLLPILYIAASVVIIIAVLIWWASS